MFCSSRKADACCNDGQFFGSECKEMAHNPVNKRIQGLISRQFPEVQLPKELLMQVKQTVLVCTANGDMSETTRWRTSPSVLHFFLAHLLYAQPGHCLNSSLAGTLDVAVSMMEQRKMTEDDAPALHKSAMQIIRAAANHEPMQLLLAVNASLGSGSWVAAHAAMLLYRDPRFADALDEALPVVRCMLRCRGR
jgi:hypothetical protein